MTGQLPAKLEVSALVRKVETGGDFAAIVHRGDEDRGSILLLVGSRGRHILCLERLLTVDGDYRWQTVGPGESADSQEISEFLAKRSRFDADFWAIELDVAQPERFVAETTSIS